MWIWMKGFVEAEPEKAKRFACVLWQTESELQGSYEKGTEEEKNQRKDWK